MSRRQTRLWAIGCIVWALAFTILGVWALVSWDHGFRACALDVFLILINIAVIAYQGLILRRTFGGESRWRAPKARKNIGPRQEWLP